MTLPGREDDLLFQKKTSDMKKLAPMKMLHADGTVISFHGIKLEDDGKLINRFLHKPGKSPVVVIAYDSNKHHLYWRCSCGGTNLPYYVCEHLKYLEILPNISDAVIILNHEEFTHYEKTVLSEVQNSKLKNTFEENVKELGESFKNFGHVAKNAVFPDLKDLFPTDTTLLGLDADGNEIYSHSSPPLPKQTYKCSMCGFESEDPTNSSTLSLIINETQIDKFVCNWCRELYNDDMLDPGVIDQMLITKKKKKKSKTEVSFRDFDDQFVKPRTTPIPKIKGKRIFADKDEEV